MAVPLGGAIVLATAPLAASVAAGDPGAAGGGGADWVQYLLQGGPFALILVLILTDKLAPTSERNRLRIENEQYKRDIQELNNKLLQVLPGLTEAATIMTRVGDLLEEMDRTAHSPPRQRGRGGQ